MKKKHVNILVKDTECTGCGTCTEICPQVCIKMQEDEQGFQRPFVNVEKCVDCGACSKLCPSLNKIETNDYKAAYAARVKDETLLFSSNSGGIFSALAQWVITEKTGLVCGAAFDDNLVVHHRIISDIDDLSFLQGSKYVQSSAWSCFKSIRDVLKQERYVLFSGTGCQIAGLKSYLGKPYDTLITVEMVCHGVPSPGLFRLYIGWLSAKVKARVEKFSFRFKSKNRAGEHGKFRYETTSRTYKGYSYKDPYYASFLHGKSLRSSCYKCQYKGQKRVSDFTIGDFWGIEKFMPNFPAKGGVCMVMVNTEIGSLILDEIKENLFIENTTFEVCAIKNPSLRKPSEDKSINYKLNDNALFDEILAPHISLKEWIKSRIPHSIKSILKKYL